MEEMTLEEWIKTLDIREDLYFATYDNFGNIISVIGTGYPETIEGNKIRIDDHLAIDIIEGKEHVFSYKIDTENYKIYKVDEIIDNFGYVLHRIIEDKWSDLKDPDVSILCDVVSNEITIQLSPRFDNVVWTGERDMTFFITEYNDPNILIDTITINPVNITGKSQTFNNLDLSKNFSIFTKPIFKTYTLSIK
jgi:hypothetical protein